MRKKKNNYVVKNKRQAVRGKVIKKRNISKFTNKLKSLAVLIWKPVLILPVVMAALLMFVYEKVNINQMLPIKAVKIEGEFEYLDKEQLRVQAIPVVNGGFFNVNLAAVRNVLVTLPWVEDVSVRRKWPDELLVRVIEKQPVVLWGEDGIISSKGKLFIPLNKPLLNLPHLTGPQGQHKNMLKELARMQAWVLETGLHIQNIELNARRSWTLKMSSGMELRLGRKQMHERLNRFVSVFKETLETKKLEIKYIDMRYTNGFSVAWKEV